MTSNIVTQTSSFILGNIYKFYVNPDFYTYPRLLCCVRCSQIAIPNFYFILKNIEIKAGNQVVSIFDVRCINCDRLFYVAYSGNTSSTKGYGPYKIYSI